MTEPVGAAPFTRRTAWARSLQTPLGNFLRTESGSATVLLAATLIALAWANIDVASYESVWQMPLSIRLGGSGVSQTLREWVNSGLMTFFFFIIGLE
ncbi:MAG: Na+/H+ antiporter NhaA, partial [Pseudonocardiaceae bacterium]